MRIYQAVIIDEDGDWRTNSFHRTKTGALLALKNWYEKYIDEDPFDADMPEFPARNSEGWTRNEDGMVYDEFPFGGWKMEVTTQILED